MLARLAAALGRPIPIKAPTFADNDRISPWAFDAVGQIQSVGIMQGVGNNRFDPKGPYTTEQSIATMLRLYDYIMSLGGAGDPQPQPEPDPPPDPQPQPEPTPGDVPYPRFPSVPDLGALFGISPDSSIDGHENEYWYTGGTIAMFNEYTALLVSKGFVNTVDFPIIGMEFRDYEKDGITVNVFFDPSSGYICIEIFYNS